MGARERLNNLLGHPRFAIVAALIAVALASPSLWLGLQLDDYVLKLELMGNPPDPSWSRSPTRVFAFIDGDEELVHRLIEDARIPWWTHPRLKLAFLRPITGLTHWIDFRLWPGHPWLMHVQSLLWFAGAVFAAAVLYRRLVHYGWIAGLAALLFAIDDAHGMPASWLANRNASIGVLFGLLALTAHDRWRRDGWRIGALLSPAALLCGLLSGEIALAAGGYLVAYALFIDDGSWQRRLNSLVPTALVGAVWWVAYRWLGYGAFGSGVYIDPGADPALYIQAAIVRAPQLFSGLWGPSSGLFLMFSNDVTRALWWAAVAFAAVVTALLAPVMKRSGVARFFFLGMILSLLPLCATFPDDRLLFFAGFGAMGLLAQLLASVRDRADWVPRSPMGRLPLQAACWFFVLFHLVLAPFGLTITSHRVGMFGTIFERAAESLPSEPAVRDQIALIVNSPTAFISFYSPLIQSLEGRPVPKRTLILGSGIHPTTISRPAPDVLSIRPVGGFLATPGEWPPGHGTTRPMFHPAHFLQMLDHLYRDATPMKEGELIEYGEASIEVTEITDDGRPAEVWCHFDTDIEDPSLRWLRWENGVYRPFEPPAIGDKIVLPSVIIPW